MVSTTPNIPDEGYFGISAATGGLSDDHDVMSFIVHSLHPLDEGKEVGYCCMCYFGGNFFFCENFIATSPPIAGVQLCGVCLLKYLLLKATEGNTKEYQERFDQYAEELTKKRGT